MISLFNRNRCAAVISHALLIILMFSCAADDAVEPGKRSLWAPILEVKKGDGTATLEIIDPRPFSNYAAPGPEQPKHLSIFISEDQTNFTFLNDVEPISQSVVIDNLTNGKAYYFRVTGIKEGFDQAESDPVMTIPSPILDTETYDGTPDLDFKNLSASHDRQYLSFVSASKLYVKTASSSNVAVVDQEGYSVSWSPAVNEFIYMISTQEGITQYPYQLKIFDAVTEQQNVLLEVPFHQYYVASPSFTPDNKISYFSSEGNSQKYVYDLWIHDRSNNQRVKLTDFDSRDFLAGSRYSWATSGEEVYLEGRFDNNSLVDTPASIFKFNRNTKVLTPVIQSRWDDYSPLLSPDNTKMIFISTRSGRNELWLCNLTNSTLRQLTGEGQHVFDSRYTTPQWLTNDELLLTVSDNAATVAIKLKVE
jgi:hypothetical protein